MPGTQFEDQFQDAWVKSKWSLG